MLEVDRDGRVRLSGCLNMQNVGELVLPLAEQVSQHGVLIVDLSSVTEVDSAALALLLNTQRAAHRNRHKVMVENWPQSLKSLLSLYGLENLLSVAAGDA